MITTVEQFIAELGGTTKAAIAFETRVNTVSMWKKRKRFPPWAMPYALDIARTNKMRVDPRLLQAPRTSEVIPATQ
jgi:hypothetical protein